MSSQNIPLGPHDDPETLRCGYCKLKIDENGFCHAGCVGITQRLNLLGQNSPEDTKDDSES